MSADGPGETAVVFGALPRSGYNGRMSGFRRCGVQDVGIAPTSAFRRAAGSKLPSSLALGLGLGLGLGLLGCHTDAPPPLAMAETSSIGSDEAPPESALADAPAPEDAAEGTRALWFAAGPGREAILARERRDHDGAVALLDALLATPELPAAERAGAELLRALEHLRREQWPEAADRLAAARSAEVLAPLAPQLRVLEAQARLDAGDSAAARDLVADLSPDRETGVPARVLLIRADAQARTMDREAAIASYRGFLRAGEGRELLEARRKLASLLLEGSAEQRREAGEQFEQLALEVPLSDYGVEAQAALGELERDGVVVRDRQQRRRYQRELALAEAQAHLDRRSYAAAARSADAFMKRGKALGADAAARCRALYIKGSAIFKQRKRAAAQPVFDVASRHCEQASDRGREVKTRYQAARGLYAGGKHEQAAKRFESLARDHADHSYADDAWIKAGESWESAGKADAARTAYEAALKVRGDMADEARRRLLVQAFAAGERERAVQIIDAALAAGDSHGDALAKLHYFRARALEDDAEIEAAYLRAIETRPLSYPALQALSRLRERGEASFARGLDLLERSAEAELPTLELPSTAAAKRVALWARLGLGEQARDELAAARIVGWPAVAALAQAGLHSEAQRSLAKLGSSWRRDPPAGERRQLWERESLRPRRHLMGRRARADPAHARDRRDRGPASQARGLARGPLRAGHQPRPRPALPRRPRRPLGPGRRRAGPGRPQLQRRTGTHRQLAGRARPLGPRLVYRGDPL